jgi:hypothetical protein
MGLHSIGTKYCSIILEKWYKHGQKMRVNDPTTWLQADTVIEIDEHLELGQVRVSQWLDLHFYRATQQRVI